MYGEFSNKTLSTIRKLVSGSLTITQLDEKTLLLDFPASITIMRVLKTIGHKFKRLK